MYQGAVTADRLGREILPGRFLFWAEPRFRMLCRKAERMVSMRNRWLIALSAVGIHISIGSVCSAQRSRCISAVCLSLRYLRHARALGHPRPHPDGMGRHRSDARLTVPRAHAGLHGYPVVLRCAVRAELPRRRRAEDARGAGGGEGTGNRGTVNVNGLCIDRRAGRVVG